MSDFEVEDRDYDLWLLLARTHYRVKQARTSELRRLGLTPEQAGILYYVNASGNNAMPTEISRWMMREPQTITSVIDRMEKKGLIKKSRDDERKNVVRISLTDKGRRVLEHSNQRESFHKIMSVLSDEKRESLREILNDLREATKQLERQSQNDPEE